MGLEVRHSGVGLGEFRRNCWLVCGVLLIWGFGEVGIRRRGGGLGTMRSNFGGELFAHRLKQGFVWWVRGCLIIGNNFC